MLIQELNVEGYRSIRKLRLPLRKVNVLTGPNGCGKSNLYQSMYLLAAAAQGELAAAFASEGGMPSAMWAGPRRTRSKQEEKRISLKVSLEDFDYELRCGLPIPPGHTTRGEPSQFLYDPEVKEEALVFKQGQHKITLMERKNSSAWVRDDEGSRIVFPFDFLSSESILSNLREPHRYPQLSSTATLLQSWRFYHQFRTDAASPLRQPQVGVRSPVLHRDGTNLAAALQTVREIGDRGFLAEAIDQAFPGAKLTILSEMTRFRVQLQMPGINRPFEAGELSDGTLRYLCLLAALLSPRPPALLALNEPETSLHPDLLLPLAKLIAQASHFSQLWITSHSQTLANAIEEFTGQSPVILEKIDGATGIVGAGLLDA